MLGSDSNSWAYSVLGHTLRHAGADRTSYHVLGNVVLRIALDLDSRHISFGMQSHLDVSEPDFTFPEEVGICPILQLTGRSKVAFKLGGSMGSFWFAPPTGYRGLGEMVKTQTQETQATGPGAAAAPVPMPMPMPVPLVPPADLTPVGWCGGRISVSSTDEGFRVAPGSYFPTAWVPGLQVTTGKWAFEVTIDN